MANASARMPVGGVLTPRMERMIRLGSIGSAIIIAISAMVLSYAGLHDLALDAEIHPRFALLVPIMVDGLQFVGSLGVVYSTLSGLRSWYPWLLMLMGVSVSAWGNWQAAPDQLTAKLLHAAAPIILALVLEELLRVMRHKVHLHADRQAALVEADDHTEAQTAERADVPVAAQITVAEDPVVKAEPVSTPEPVAAPPVEPFRRVEVPAPQATPSEPAAPAAPAAEHEGSQVPAPEEAAVVGERPAQFVEAVATSEAPLVASQPVVTEPRVVERSSQPTTQPAMQATSQPTAAVTVEPATEKVVEPPKAVEPRPAQSGDVLPPYPKDATYKEQVRAILEQDPSLNGGTIARIMGKDASNTRKIVREWRAEVDAAAAADRAAANGAPAAPESTLGTQSSSQSAIQSRPASPPPPATAVAPAGPPEVVDFKAADPFGTSVPVGAGR